MGMDKEMCIILPPWWNTSTCTITDTSKNPKTKKGVKLFLIFAFCEKGTNSLKIVVNPTWILARSEEEALFKFTEENQDNIEPDLHKVKIVTKYSV